MGMISGDKARYNRQRRKKLAKRVEMRALRAQLAGGGSAEAKPAATPAAGRAARPKSA